MTNRHILSLMKAPFVFIWYLWFVIINVFLLLFFIPYTAILIAFHADYKKLYWLQVFWARANLFLLGFSIELDKKILVRPYEPYYLIANHASSLDIFVLLAIHPKNPFKFIGKKEIVKVPVLGWYYKHMSIMVDRGSLKSKKRVYQMALENANNGISIGVFPEGGIPDDKNVLLDKFKDGAFAMSEETNISIAPYAFFNTRRYMPYGNWWKGGPGKIKVSVLPILSPENKTRGELKAEAHATILKALENE